MKKPVRVLRLQRCQDSSKRVGACYEVSRWLHDFWRPQKIEKLRSEMVLLGAQPAAVQNLVHILELIREAIPSLEGKNRRELEDAGDRLKVSLRECIESGRPVRRRDVARFLSALSTANLTAADHGYRPIAPQSWGNFGISTVAAWGI